MTKSNCYACQHRGDLPGNTHSQCLHQDANTPTAKALLPILFLLRSTVHVSDNLQVSAEPHGIASGWFLYPMNFDPIWLISCTGFTPAVKRD